MKKQSLVLGMLVLAGTFLVPNAPALADATDYATDNVVDCFYEYNQGSAACDALKLSEAEENTKVADRKPDRVAFLMHR